MSDINTTEARELFERTTQGKWEIFNNYFLIDEDGAIVLDAYDTDNGVDQAYHDLLFARFAHNNWQEMLDTIERLKAFEQCVNNAMQWEPETCKAVIESARVELRIKRGEIID